MTCITAAGLETLATWTQFLMMCGLTFNRNFFFLPFPYTVKCKLLLHVNMVSDLQAIIITPS